MIFQNFTAEKSMMTFHIKVKKSTNKGFLSARRSQKVEINKNKADTNKKTQNEYYIVDQIF